MVYSSTARTLHPAALETSGLYIHLFPVLLFPLNHISMTGSILSTVAVTLERFVATHRPIYYNTVVKDATGHARLYIIKYFSFCSLNYFHFDLSNIFHFALSNIFEKN